MMDSILLLFAARISKCQVKKKRIFLGAAAGSLLTCLVIALPIPSAALKMILFHGFVNVFMLKAGLGVNWGRDLVYAWILLYVSGFLLGGAMMVFRPYIQSLSLFFLLAVGSYYLLLKVWELITAFSRQRDFQCTVLVSCKGRTLKLQALIDSGNSLRDAQSGKPVHIVGRQAIRGLWKDEPVTGLRYVSYHSVGRENGVMPLLELDRMKILRRRGNETETITIDRPLVAVCEEEKVTEQYDIILNLDI